MSYEDNGRRPYRNFRSTLDIAMGLFYILIGGVVINVKYFGTIELPNVYAYGLGGLLLLYGAFRIYRGIVAIRQKREP